MKFRHLIVVVAASCCALAQTTIYNTSPSRAFGQPRLTNISSGNPNLVEGREFYLPQSVALDTASNPNKLYIADTVNNRVLAWRDASAITKGNMADLAIGQLDLTSTRPGGPATSQTTGLTTPTAVAVDSEGNVFVADAGNNRVLRFPKPFSQTGETPQPDLVIGQRTFSSDNRANQGNAVPDRTTLALASSSAYRTTLAFDRQGNLWLADPGNNRVLRYPAASLTPGTILPAADFVLGQQDFVTRTVTEGNSPRLNKSTLITPSGLAFAENGDLYVSDARLRVLYFKAPLATFGQAAQRIIGIPTPTEKDPNPRALNGCPATTPQPCEAALGAVTASSTVIPPEGIAVLNGSLYVADPGNNRIVKFDPPASWPTECNYTGQVCAANTAISPTGVLFLGQTSGQSVKVNRGGLPAADTLAQPVALTFNGTDMWVADASNHRVLMFPQSGGTYTSATRVLGQLDFTFNAPNLVEGRELFLYDPLSRVAAGAIAVDKTTEPPHLYIADTLNNRVLGFRDARNVRPGTTPDLVVGQPDLLTTTPNTFTKDADQPSDQTLIGPVGLLVDKVGDLWVADSGNSRVLRFSRPFEQPAPAHANLVLGQQNVFVKITDARRNQMRTPWGLAMNQSGNYLAVSDASHNRVLIFRKPDGGDFTSGQAAETVIGQPDFLTTASGNDRNRFNSPRGIALDTSDRLYVADSGNNRVSIFTGIGTGEIDPSARFTSSITTPQGIAVSAITGEAWVTDLSGGRLVRYPIFEDWFLNGQPIGEIRMVSGSAPIAVALDASDNPIVAETINRVSMYYPQNAFANSASYSNSGLTPGMLANIARRAPAFAPGTQESVQQLPLPTTVADIRVLMNGTPVPIFQVLADRVTIQVPWNAPSTGTADFELVRASTGEVLGAATFRMVTAAPGFFTTNAQGTGQLAAFNQDGTVNSATNAAARGSVISLVGTGIGPIDNAPPSGQAPSSALSAAGKPRVSMANPGPGVLADSDVLYYGLVTWFPGVFQLNVKIPESVPPSNTVNVGLVWKDYFSTEGPNGTRLTTTIAVK